jgi:hypothetical protein
MHWYWWIVVVALVIGALWFVAYVALDLWQIRQVRLRRWTPPPEWDKR